MHPEIMVGDLKVKKGITIGAFLDDGWVVDSIGEAIGHRYNVHIQKGDDSAYVNMEGNCIIGEDINRNAVISSIYIVVSEHLALNLLGGLTQVSKVQDFVDVLGVPHNYSIFDPIIYIWYGNNQGFDKFVSINANFDMQGNLKAFCLKLQVDTSEVNK